MWMRLSVDEHEKRILQRWWLRIAQAYAEEQRAYHTMEHLVSMIMLFKKYQDTIVTESALMPRIVEKIMVMAITFHDIVYDPKLSENELKSIEVFQEFLAECPEIVNEMEAKMIQDMIACTIRHELQANLSPPQVVLTAWFLDFDLQVLSQAAPKYDIYATQIRQEYTMYDEESYCNGRCKVLQHFLERETLYFTWTFQVSAESIARENLLREISFLSPKTL